MPESNTMAKVDYFSGVQGSIAPKFEAIVGLYGGFLKNFLCFIDEAVSLGLDENNGAKVFLKLFMHCITR